MDIFTLTDNNPESPIIAVVAAPSAKEARAAAVVQNPEFSDLWADRTATACRKVSMGSKKPRLLAVQTAA